jgi:hypothetical protein
MQNRIETLTRDLVDEVAAWRSMINTGSLLHGRLERLGELSQARVAAVMGQPDRMREVSSASFTKEASVVQLRMFTAACDDLARDLRLQTESLQQLETAIDGVGQRILALREADASRKVEFDSRFESSVAAVAVQSAEAVETLGERSVSTTQELSTQLHEQVPEMLQEAFTAAIDSLDEAAGTAAEDIALAVDELAHVATGALAEVAEALDINGKAWRDGARRLSSEYDQIFATIERIENDVATVVTGVTDAMNLSGLGANAAARSLEDITNVMAGLA